MARDVLPYRVLDAVLVRNALALRGFYGLERPPLYLARNSVGACALTGCKRGSSLKMDGVAHDSLFARAALPVVWPDRDRRWPGAARGLARVQLPAGVHSGGPVLAYRRLSPGPDGFRPTVEVHEGYLAIGKRIIPWMDIRRLDRTGWISPLIVRITLFDDSRLLLIYPGDLDSCNSLLRHLRRLSRDALIDGIPYRQYWGEVLAPGSERKQAAPPPPVSHPAAGRRGRSRTPVPAAEDGRQPRPEELHGREVVGEFTLSAATPDCRYGTLTPCGSRWPPFANTSGAIAAEWRWASSAWSSRTSRRPSSRS